MISKINSIEYSEDAEKDIKEVVDYYNSLDKKLVTSLFKEIKLVEKKVLFSPKIYHIRYKNIRRVNLKKFPFCLFYIIESSKIIVLSVVHEYRDPTFWP